jgi:hypothetical protein
VVDSLPLIEFRMYATSLVRLLDRGYPKVVSPPPSPNSIQIKTIGRKTWMRGLSALGRTPGVGL